MSKSETKNEFLESIGYVHRHNIYGSSISAVKATDEGCIFKKLEQGFRYANYDGKYTLDPDTDVTVDDIEVVKTSGDSIEYITVDKDSDTVKYYLQGNKEVWDKEITDIVAQSLPKPDLLVVVTTDGTISGLDLNLKGLADFEYSVNLENDVEGITATEDHILIHDDQSISLLDLRSGDELYSEELGDEIRATALVGDLIVVETTESLVGNTTSGDEKFSELLSPDSVGSSNRVLHMTCDKSVVVATAEGAVQTIEEEFRGTLYQMSGSSGVVHKVNGDLNLYEREEDGDYISLELDQAVDKELTVTNISDRTIDNVELQLNGIQHTVTESDSIELSGGLLPGEADSLPMEVVGENPTVKITHGRGEREEILIAGDDTPVTESTPADDTGSSDGQSKQGTKVEVENTDSPKQDPASKSTEEGIEDEKESAPVELPELYEMFRQEDSGGRVGDETSKNKYEGVAVETSIAEEKIEASITDANGTVLNEEFSLHIDFSTRPIELKLHSQDRREIDTVEIPIDELQEKFDWVSGTDSPIDTSSSEDDEISEESTSAPDGMDRGTANIVTGGSPRHDRNHSTSSEEESDESEERSPSGGEEESRASGPDKHRRQRYRTERVQDQGETESEFNNESGDRDDTQNKKNSNPLDDSIRSADTAEQFDLNRRFYKLEWSWKSSEPKNLKECISDTIDVKFGEILMDVLTISLPIIDSDQDQDSGEHYKDLFSKIIVNRCYENESEFILQPEDDIWDRNHEICLYSTITLMNDLKKEIPDRTIEIDGTEYHATNQNSNEYINSSTVKGNYLHVHPYLYLNPKTGLHDMRLVYGPNASEDFDTGHLRGYIEDIQRTKYAQADQGAIHAEEISGGGYGSSSENPVIIDKIRLDDRQLAGNGIPYRFKFDCPATRSNNTPNYISTVAPRIESSEWKNQTWIVNGLVSGANSVQFEEKMDG